MNNALSKKITLFSLIKFTAPTIIMMIIMALYTMIDGMFVSRFVNTSALSAVNIVYPVLSIVLALAIMLSTGGSAIIARQMGEGKPDEARKNFSLLIYLGIAIGFTILILGMIFIDPILKFLGADSNTYGYCYDYAMVLLAFVPFSVLQMMFQFFFVTAGKPQIGLIVTIISGVTNTVLDYVFIGLLDMGTAGAALGTGIGFMISAVTGLVYFSFYRKGTLYIVKPRIDKSIIWESCSNGASEMVTNLSVAITTFLFNITMIKYMGEDGVAAITIVLYAEYLFNAVFLGYSSGIAPVISYNYGNKNTKELKKIFKLSYGFVITTSIIVLLVSSVLSEYIIMIFAKQGSEVFYIAQNGFKLFSVAFLFMGFNIFTSALFTALSNGKVSAALSFLRSFLFLIPSIVLLPLALGANGIWLAIPVSEVLALTITVLCIVRNRRVYEYF